jgi:predicted  nucleic acid-binding Zn-ribbon protein
MTLEILEIERLRLICADAIKHLEEAEAEIARLHAEIETRKTAVEKVYLEQDAEIERLTALVVQQSRKHDADMLAMQLAHNREIEWLTPKAENWQRIATEITASEHALRLDNEQLRAAICDAVEALERGSTSAPVLEVLQATLKPKP